MEEYVNISQAARMLGVSRTLVYRLVSDGALTAVRNPLYKAPGGPVRIPMSDIERLAAEKGITLPARQS